MFCGGTTFFYLYCIFAPLICTYSFRFSTYHFYTIFPHFMQFTLNFIYSCFMSLGSTVSYFCVDVNLFPTSFSCLVYSLSIWNLRLSRLRIKEYYIEYRVKVLEWSGLLLLHCALKVYGGISVIQSSECCHATIITEGLYYHNFIPVTLPNNSSRFLKRIIFSLCPNIFMGLTVH